MSQNSLIKLKRSSVPGRVPSTSSLDLGEIAINTFDGCLFFKKDGTNGEEIVTVCSGGSGGNESLGYTNSTFLTTSEESQTVDTFQGSLYQTAKYLITVTKETQGFFSTEILLIHDGSDVYITEYASLWTIDSLGTFGGKIVDGTVHLTFSPKYVNTLVNLQRITIVAAQLPFTSNLIETVTANGELFLTSDNNQFIVQGE